MKHLETVSGKGSVISKGGRTAVEFELKLYQSEIKARTRTNPDLKVMKGRVRPFCGTLGEMLTLETNNGKAAKFYFVDTLGRVHVNWFGDSSALTAAG